MFRSPRLDIANIVTALGNRGAVSVPMLTDAYRRQLLAEARACSFRPARASVGEGERIVHQRMEVHAEFAPESDFCTLARAFQTLWDDSLADHHENPFEGRLVFNDLMLQRYGVGAVGITPHRDRTAYRNLVCLFILAGRGRFYLCDDRSGRGAREIRHEPGDVLLMRAPGFRGSDQRPFHLVRDIQEPRYVFGLRQQRL